MLREAWATSCSILRTVLRGMMEKEFPASFKHIFLTCGDTGESAAYPFSLVHIFSYFLGILGVPKKIKSIKNYFRKAFSFVYLLREVH